MNVPSDEERAAILAAVYPEGLPEGTQEVGLSQPSWFKNQEIAESAAADVAQAMAHKLGLTDFDHTYRIVEREGAARALVVEVRARR
jgi:hypothetical protein